MPKLKTHEQFLSEVYDLVGGNYTLLSEYLKSNIKIKIKHNICGQIYTVKPNDFLSGNRCPICYGTHKKTTDMFKNEVFDLVADEYSVLGEYCKNDKKIEMIHNVCGHKYYVNPSSFLGGTRCPICYGTYKKTTDMFKNEVFDLVSGEYSVLGEYFDSKIKIQMVHNICGHVYKIKPSLFLFGNRCPKCSNKIKKTTEEFKDEVSILTNDEYSVLGNYVNSKTKIKIHHYICDSSWDIVPNAFLNGNRCPKCSTRSNGEHRIIEWLEDQNINYNREKTFKGCINPDTGKHLRYDFYIPKSNILIEFDGIQHFEPTSFGSNISSHVKNINFINVMVNDDIKDDYALNNNIKLVRIPYWDYDNIFTILELEML